MDGLSHPDRSPCGRRQSQTPDNTGWIIRCNLRLVHECINTVTYRSSRQSLSIVIGYLPFIIEDSQFRVVK